MSNRASRRAENKKKSRYQRMTVEQKTTAMCKQGISPKDLQEAYNQGRDEGIKMASSYCLKDAYAAFLMAAHEVFGFGPKRCKRLLYAADERVVNSLSSDEAIDEVFRTVGVTINFYDPERITETFEA